MGISLVVLMFVGVMRVACSENTDPLGLLYHDEPKNAGSSNEDNFHIGSYDSHLEDKNFDKRRTVYPETDNRDLNSSGESDRYSETREYEARKKNHFAEIEGERRGSDWHMEDYEKNKYAYGAGFDQGDNRVGQFYKEQTGLRGRFHWRNRENVGEERQPLTVEANRYSKDYSVVGDVNGYDRTSFGMDPRELRQPKHFDEDTLRSTHSFYSVFPKMNYNGFHNMECCGTDKPLIINVNTDCFPPNKNLYVHRFLTPKPNLNTPSQVSSYQMHDSSVLSSPNQGYYPSYKR